MKLILRVNDYNWPIPTDRFSPALAEIAWTSEAAGFDRIGPADELWRSHTALGEAHRR
jgi:hypothetical protein